MENNKTVTLGQPAISRYLLAGLTAGIIAAIVANIWYAIYQASSGNSFAELNILTITATSLITSVIGGLVFYALNRYTRQPVTIFVAAGLVIGALSSIPNFVSPPNPAAGFATASAPMHYIVAIVAVIVIPLMSRKQA